ncbi:TIR domain-containing protein [Altererythrobacter sp. MF3-039]|uniref:TIR domain-containing protein n=1 Tax=Altererythrobacter sp. MF3-039 TaxID=3252901 RepID=UPI00390CB7CF
MLAIYFQYGEDRRKGGVLADIFLSYSRADQPQIQQLAEKLTDAGYSLWWDQNIQGGKRFAKDIEEAITHSRAVIVAWSAHSVESEWVLDEASYGRDHNKLVPILLDATPPPFGYRQRQALDFSGGVENDSAMQSLIAALDELVGGEHHAPEAASNIGSKPLYKRAELVLPIAALVLAGGAWLAMGVNSASDVEGADMALTLATAEIDRSKSVAVLPFRDLSAGDGNNWFVDGIGDEINYALSRTPDLIVASSGSVAGYADGNTPSPQVAKELGVANVLEGTVRQAGDRLRVTVSLVDLEGKQVWSQRYDRPTDDMIVLQEEIAASVAKALNTALDPVELQQMTSLGTTSVEAYQKFRASEHITSGNDAIAALEEVISLDPEFARAYIDLGYMYFQRTQLGSAGWLDRTDLDADWELMQQVMRRAEAVSKTDVDRAMRRAFEGEVRGQWDSMIAAEEKAFELAPNNLTIVGALANSYALTGQDQKTLALVDRIENLDQPSGLRKPGLLFGMRRYEDAARAAADAMAAAPSSYSHAFRAHHHALHAGDAELATRALDRLKQIIGPDGKLTDLQIFRQACFDGDRTKALEILARTELDDERYMMLSMLGEKKKAREAIIQYDRSKPPFPIGSLTYKPYFDIGDFPNFAVRMRAQGVVFRKPDYPIYCPA